MSRKVYETCKHPANLYEWIYIMHSTTPIRVFMNTIVHYVTPFES